MKKLGLLVASGLAALALAAPASTPAQGIDVGETCASILGNQEGDIDLRPVAWINFQTCEKADLDDE
jgi:hypothetical protein